MVAHKQATQTGTAGKQGAGTSNIAVDVPGGSRGEASPTANLVVAKSASLGGAHGRGSNR
jgi:hypothetical protein